jgi:hypothetical protein
MYQSTQQCIQEDGSTQINLVCEAWETRLLCTVLEYPLFHVFRICQYRQCFWSSVWIMLCHFTKLSDNKTKKNYIANAKSYHWSWSWASSIHVPDKYSLFSVIQVLVLLERAFILSKPYRSLPIGIILIKVSNLVACPPLPYQRQCHRSVVVKSRPQFL